MSYEFFYQKTPYSLGVGYSSYGDLFSGYRTQAAQIGLSTDPRTANQISDLFQKINTGEKVFEISLISPQILDSIPKQHLKELNRLTKLTGVEATVHGPLIEPSGFTQQGWSEASRKLAENQMLSAIERAHEINPEGNINVTFHSAVLLPQTLEKIKEKEEKIKSVLVVDPQTGEIAQIKEEKRYFPEEYPPGFDPEEEIKRRNKEIWLRTLDNLNFYSMRGIEIADMTFQQVDNLISHLGIPPDQKEKYKEIILKSYADPNFLENLPPQEKEIVSGVFRNLDQSIIFLRDSYNMLKNLYNKAYENATEKEKRVLERYAREIEPYVKQGIERDPQKIQKFAEIISKGVKVLSQIENPNLYQPLDKFIIDKSSETIANVALNSYEKFKEKSPIISIENPPIGTALSRADELKELIEKAREKFKEKMIQRGMSEKEAKEIANKLIGATWDVGHINMLRRYGYESRDIIKETEKIAPYIKHVHLSDNFGMEHTELPIGMGNVPIKEIMKELEKAGKSDVKKIAETADWWQHFKTPPTQYLLEAFGSPIYSMMMAPYWNQFAFTYGDYFSGYGKILPEQHFSIYGSGFSSLPTELGGQIPGTHSRVSGTPMD